ncbi:hypothetical protein ANN_00164 [Periplaneta americana]|uniref:Uncharacterized protein n=1 Tax=Periplaneta americana TaxID=6978 RepID=A0ABQ8TSD5_PERAM|nr:hypothetical protein ANN_00164 [Periplaneta americana]
MDLREVGYDGRDWFNLDQDWDRWRAYVYYDYRDMMIEWEVPMYEKLNRLQNPVRLCFKRLPLELITRPTEGRAGARETGGAAKEVAHASSAWACAVRSKGGKLEVSKSHANRLL